MNPSTRLEQEQLQQANLKIQREKFPELFPERTYIDNTETLEPLGISIPNKDSFPIGFLKLYAQDFIVEEVCPDGSVCTVSPDKPIDSGTSDRTVFATLVKCNISTFEAVEELSMLLGCSTQNIQYAGIKDKVAITAQRISFRDIAIEKIIALKSDHFFLKDIHFGKGVLNKGDLQGNRFTILVRTEEQFFDPQTTQAFIRQFEKIKNSGFYNFYYIQRFANPRLISFHWGYDILVGNYRNAIFNILTQPGERESLFFKQLRNNIEKNFGNWGIIKTFIDPYPLVFQHELKLVTYLQKHPTDYLGALKSVPDLVTMWIYALSSWFFNKKISEYITNNEEPPQKLPLFTTTVRDELALYTNLFKLTNIFPPPFQNLRPFPQIRLQSRLIETKEHPAIHKIEIIPEGFIIQFTLNKGEYATTFLSHLFNLASGKIPETFSKKEIDIFEALHQYPLRSILQYFDKVLRKPIIEN